jgi:hypothetical protein
MYTYLLEIRVQVGKEKSRTDPVVFSEEETHRFTPSMHLTESIRVSLVTGGKLAAFRSKVKFLPKKIRSIAESGTLYIECVEVSK